MLQNLVSISSARATCTRAVLPSWWISAHTMTLPPTKNGRHSGHSVKDNAPFNVYRHVCVHRHVDRRKRGSSETKTVFHLTGVDLTLFWQHCRCSTKRCAIIMLCHCLPQPITNWSPSHRQDNTYHSLCYTSRGALAGTRNSTMGPPHEGSVRRPIAPWANALPLSYVLLLETPNCLATACWVASACSKLTSILALLRYLQCRYAICFNQCWFGLLCPTIRGFSMQSFRTSTCTCLSEDLRGFCASVDYGYVYANRTCFLLFLHHHSLTWFSLCTWFHKALFLPMSSFFSWRVYVCMYVCMQWRSKVPKSGGAHRHVIYVPSVKNQNKRVVFGCMVI